MSIHTKPPKPTDPTTAAPADEEEMCSVCAGDAEATYTVMENGKVLARGVGADDVARAMLKAEPPGDATVVDDRDGTVVIPGTDGDEATMNMVETLLEEHEAQHVVAPGARPFVPGAAVVSKLVRAGDYRALWTTLLATLPRCTSGCGRMASFQTTYSSEFSCGMTDRDCEQPDGDRWEEVPWRAHVEAVADPSDLPVAPAAPGGALALLKQAGLLLVQAADAEETFSSVVTDLAPDVLDQEMADRIAGLPDAQTLADHHRKVAAEIEAVVNAVAPTAPAHGPYTIRWRADVGYAVPSAPAGEHMPLTDVLEWLDCRGDDGTFVIVNESDGRVVAAEELPRNG